MRKRRKSEVSSSVNTKDTIQKFLQSGLLKKNDIVMQQSHIRVMVFAEKSNRLRFDSDTIKLVTEDPEGLDMTKSPCGRLMFAPQKSDTKLIGDHIFGDAQHMLEAGGCKIHKNVSGRVMVSRIFALPREKDMGNVNFNIESEVRTAVQLWNSYLNEASTVKPTTSRSSYFDTEPPEYMRRISKNKKLTFSRIPLQSSDCTVSYGSSHRLGSTIKSLNVVRLIAISVLFDSDFFEFIIGNLHFIDREMRNLQHRLFEALCGDKSQFHWNSATACYDFRLNIISFHNAFRLNNFITNVSKLPSEKFFKLLNEIIVDFETKDSGYFLSKLISAILMFHLSWVATTNESYYGRISDFWTKSEFLESRSKPFLTILGCIGMLSHTTRIIITGKNLECIAKFLEIIPYFIRYHKLEKNPKNELLNDLNFSPNNIWSFKKAELLSRIKMDKEKSKNSDNLENMADKWQLGEFSALFAQKTILREFQTCNEWKIRFRNSIESKSMRSRTKSEPQKISDLTPEFRQRSTSNPLAKFNYFKKFEKYSAKDYYPDPNEFTIATGKIPYGFSIPKFSDDNDDTVTVMKKYEHEEANKIWKNFTFKKNEKFDNEEFKKNFSENSNYFNFEKKDELPYWKRNRKSSTVLARTLANNFVNFENELNPDEIEEIYEEKLNDIHYTENTIDTYFENFSDLINIGIEDLFGGINSKFEPAFVFQGIDGNFTKFKDLKDVVRKEVKHPESFYIAVPKNKNQSELTLRPKGRNNEAKELEFIQMTSVYIVANVDSGEISIISGDLQTLKEEEMVYPCDSVLSMMDKLKELYSIGSDPHTMAKLLENSLDDLVRKGSLLQQVIEFSDQDFVTFEVPFNPSSYVRDRCHAKLISEISRRHREQQQVLASQETISENKKNEKIDANAIVKILDCHYSDLRLLINICSIISPDVRSSIWTNS